MRASSRLKTFFAVFILVVVSLWSVWRVAEKPKEYTELKLNEIAMWGKDKLVWEDENYSVYQI